MRRIIVDFKKLTPEIMTKLVEKYPDGYGDDDIITFKNAKNETVEAVELRTEDTMYLVKVSTRLQDVMAEFDESDYDEDEFDEPLVDLPQRPGPGENAPEDIEDEDDEDEDEDEEDDDE